MSVKVQNQKDFIYPQVAINIQQSSMKLKIRTIKTGNKSEMKLRTNWKRAMLAGTARINS